LTGGTGFIGSQYRGGTAPQRVPVILLSVHRQQSARVEWNGCSGGQAWISESPAAQGIEAYVDRPGFGLDKGVYDSVACQTDEIIHCASNTSVSERKRAEVETVNSEGLRHVLDFARKKQVLFLPPHEHRLCGGRINGLCKRAGRNPDLHQRL